MNTEPVVSTCYWKKVCGKWLTPHHACEYGLYKKVCDPAILIQPKRSWFVPLPSGCGPLPTFAIRTPTSAHAC